MFYEVTIHTVRPGAVPQALAALQGSLAAGGGKLLACWSSEIGALNRILVIREADPAGESSRREALARENDPYGISAFAVSTACDIFASFPFLPPIKTGAMGPFFEVRTYELRPAGLPWTVEAWGRMLPGRTARSPILTAMYSTTGTVTRLMHIWPYKTLDQRGQIRAAAVADKLWPPPGGTEHFASMQSEIYVPAPFSPIR
ncbi:MAG: NIPSNAP family protein [Variibacter sp.]